MSRPALVPELYVSNLAVSMEFYVDLLGFRIEYERPEEGFVALSLGSAHLMLEEAGSLKRASPEDFQRGQWRTADLEKPFGRGVNLEIQVGEIEELHSRIARSRYPLLLGLQQRSYRTGESNRVVQQLLVADPDGYLIRLSKLLSAGAMSE
jgi:catechol 2,3-dioxygenase-like lactoylglutathione lyase family enzyme